MSSSDDKKQPTPPAPEADADGQEKRSWGRIFMGLTERDLSGVEHSKATNWTQKDEDDYLSRIREKAETKAREILEQATTEAATMRTKAMEDGYNDGMSQAEAELNDFRAGMADSASAVLGAIEAQSSQIFQTWREDLTGLLRIAVEKAVGLELAENRREVLESLYLQSVQSLESHRTLTIRANPEDEPVVADIINLTKERHLELQSWKVKADSSIEPGSLMVESESSLADNRMKSRLAAIDSILQHLLLPKD